MNLANEILKLFDNKKPEEFLTVNEISSQFPKVKKSTVRTAIKSLEQSGMLIRGSYLQRGGYSYFAPRTISAGNVIALSLPWQNNNFPVAQFAGLMISYIEGKTLKPDNMLDDESWRRLCFIMLLSVATCDPVAQSHYGLHDKMYEVIDRKINDLMGIIRTLNGFKSSAIWNPGFRDMVAKQLPIKGDTLLNQLDELRGLLDSISSSNKCNCSSVAENTKDAA